ncbi:50S ribosomal protein L27, partial [Neisseria sicca]|uniref:50S ribosomal protein L27 n=1 Tax=Neisseria sicca TaxID=490 RepID=UPI003F68BAF8
MIGGGWMMVGEGGRKLEAGEKVGMGKEESLLGKVDGYVELKRKGGVKGKRVRMGR